VRSDGAALMGRHAIPEVPADPTSPAPTTGVGLVARGVLALTAAIATALATSWAGAPWAVAGAAALGAAVVVFLAAWIAGTIPPPPSAADPPRRTGRAARSPYSDARERHPRDE